MQYFLRQQERSLLQGPALIAAVKQKMKMKEIYLSKPPVDSCKPLHTAPSSAPFCGEIVCADIGIRDEWHPAGLAQL